PAVVDRAPLVAGAGTHADPLGTVLWAALLEERLVVDAVREAAHRDAAITQVCQQGRSDARVVVDDLALAESRFGIQHLLEVRELQLSPVDRDEAVRHDRLRGLPLAWRGLLGRRLRLGCIGLAVSRLLVGGPSCRVAGTRFLCR